MNTIDGAELMREMIRILEENAKRHHDWHRQLEAKR